MFDWVECHTGFFITKKYKTIVREINQLNAGLK